MGNTEGHTQVILKQLDQGNIFGNHREVAGYHFGHDYTQSICMIVRGDIHSN